MTLQAEPNQLWHCTLSRISVPPQTCYPGVGKDPEKRWYTCREVVALDVGLNLGSLSRVRIQLLSIACSLAQCGIYRFRMFWIPETGWTLAWPGPASPRSGWRYNEVSLLKMHIFFYSWKVWPTATHLLSVSRQLWPPVPLRINEVSLTFCSS